MRTWHQPIEDKRDALGAVFGPWQHEPDKAQWIDDDTDYDCLIVRNRVGALCGYVGLPPAHPWHGCDYEGLDVDVHGGLTFAAECSGDEHSATAVCHVPEPGRPERVWWLGFDTAHAGDYMPGIAGHMPSYWHRDDVYRDFDYVRRECRALARQLHAVAFDHECQHPFRSSVCVQCGKCHCGDPR